MRKLRLMLGIIAGISQLVLSCALNVVQQPEVHSTTTDQVTVSIATPTSRATPLPRSSATHPPLDEGNPFPISRTTDTPAPTAENTATPMPDPTPAGEPETYRLVRMMADQADQAIAEMERTVQGWDTLEPSQANPGNLFLYPPYQSVVYAAWNAISLYPNDPRSEKWRWTLTYYMIYSGGGQGALEMYRQQIDDALYRQHLTPQDLPGWFHSGNMVDDYLTKPFTLQIDTLQLPGYDAGYLVEIGDVAGSESPGSSCIVISQKGTQYNSYIIHNGFPGGYSLMLRNPTSCSKKDLTGDGVDEIVVDHYSGGHIGTTHFKVVDVSSMPPKLLPFHSTHDSELIVSNGFLMEYQTEGQKPFLEVGSPLGNCDEYGINDYWWNGDWFDLIHGKINYEVSNLHNDQALNRCSGWITQYAQSLPFPDAIKVLDTAVKAYLPNIRKEKATIDEFRVLQGVYFAFSGDVDTARAKFTEISRSPIDPNSVWIKPAQDFLAIYKSQADLFRACSSVKICSSNTGLFESEEVQRNEADRTSTNKALQATVATAFANLPLEKLAGSIGTAGVNVASTGFYDFDGDGQSDLWFTQMIPGVEGFQLWIGTVSSRGTMAVPVDFISIKTPTITMKMGEGSKRILDLGGGKSYHLDRHPLTLELFVTPIDEKNPPLTNSAKFLELQQKLIQGEPPAVVYEGLLTIDAKVKGCPIKNKYNDGSISDSDECAGYFFTLGLAAELVGQDDAAVRNYYQIWKTYPANELAPLARMKLEARE